LAKTLPSRRGFIGAAGAVGTTSLVSSLVSLGVERGPLATIAQPGTTPLRAGPAISINPENPRYFSFRGKPLVLLAAGEHYGSVVNRRFDFARYLAEAADKKQTMTRTFLLFRELQGMRNPSSPVKPESPDYIAPWPRTGPDNAMDGEPKYDLDRWNSEYFDRLNRFLSLASDYGIVVELTLFSNTYADRIWALNPLRDQNNLQKAGAVDWTDYTSLRDAALVSRQTAYARKIVQETSDFDNVYYEICNEPGGGQPNHASPADVDLWQEEVGRMVREELRKLNRPHLVVGQQAFDWLPQVNQAFDRSFSGSLFDAVTVHPIPNLTLGGQTYQLGHFMSKELRLADFKKFFLAAQRFQEPCISDEDNAASLYRDEAGWTIHRKRAWMAVMCGAHYDFIDFSLTVGSEAGTEESRAKIRSWMRNLSDFTESFDFIHAAPVEDWIAIMPDHLVAGVLSRGSREYVAYLADAREVTDSAAGQPISGPVTFQLDRGTYDLSVYSPVTGGYSPSIRLPAGTQATINLQPFQHDIVLRVRRVS
jgi:hypothetical protein